MRRPETFGEAPASEPERSAEAVSELVQGREEDAERVAQPQGGNEARPDEREAALTGAIEERERALAAREGELAAREAALDEQLTVAGASEPGWQNGKEFSLCAPSKSPATSRGR